MPEKPKPKPTPKPVYKNVDGSRNLSFGGTSFPSTNLARRWQTGTNRIGNTPLEDAGVPTPRVLNRNESDPKNVVRISAVPKPKDMRSAMTPTPDMRKPFGNMGADALLRDTYSKMLRGTGSKSARANAVAKAKARRTGNSL
jgi:hypothetical protein